jgi:hypothetical protein
LFNHGFIFIFPALAGAKLFMLMRIKNKLPLLQIKLCLLLLISLVVDLHGQDKLTLSKAADEDRINAYEKQLANYLSSYLVEEYDARAAKA